jgi:hypothetical protein
MRTEIWKDIPGYEGVYQASCLGRVRSLDKIMMLCSGPYIHKGRVLKPRPGTTSPYLLVSLSRDGVRKMVLLHRIIALVFVENIDSKPEVNHINGNKFDNRPENLEWVTSSENKIHALATGLRKRGTGNGYPGVSFHKTQQKWQACITYQRRRYYLGTFDLEKDAIRARKEKEQELGI